MAELNITGLRVSQPIGTFYICAIEARDLMDISFADVRRPDGRDIERYIGTQRDLNEGRVSEIKQYVGTVDACFPTGVIVAIDSADVVVSEKDGGMVQLDIRKDQGVAKIIDGQHRIAGFDGYSGDAFYLNVTVFVEMQLEDQAMVFATINLKQTKVTKSLAYDLYEFASARSPQKTSHNIAKLLNFRDQSPLQGVIKILGKSSNQELETITQAAFVDRLMRLISREPMSDKDLIKRGKKPARATEDESKRLLFRNVFLDGDDARIALILWEYFSAVKMRWSDAWMDRRKGAILGRTTGFSALLRLLPSVVFRIVSRPLDQDSSVVHRDEFLKILVLIELESAAFTSETYLPGSTGEGRLYKDFLRGISRVPVKTAFRDDVEV